MAKILGKFLVSEDVFIYVANGDLTGISYYYNSDEAEIRAREIEKAVEKIEKELDAVLYPGSEENEIEFSTLPDEITGISEAGKRYEVLALSR
jgi:ABC-type Zn uptake system ZnuABC Zn-binding protein ZnuA